MRQSASQQSGNSFNSYDIIAWIILKIDVFVYKWFADIIGKEIIEETTAGEAESFEQVDEILDQLDEEIENASEDDAVQPKENTVADAGTVGSAKVAAEVDDSASLSKDDDDDDLTLTLADSAATTASTSNASSATVPHSSSVMDIIEFLWPKEEGKCVLSEIKVTGILYDN